MCPKHLGGEFELVEDSAGRIENFSVPVYVTSGNVTLDRAFPGFEFLDLRHYREALDEYLIRPYIEKALTFEGFLSGFR